LPRRAVRLEVQDEPPPFMARRHESCFILYNNPSLVFNVSTMFPAIPKINKALVLSADLEGGMVYMAHDLRRTGADVTKVVLCFQDYTYHWKGIPCVEYDAPLEEFKDWLRVYVKEHGVDTLVLYNDHRPYNKEGAEVAKELGIHTLVFELGLLRPNWTTIFSSQFDHFSDIKKFWDAHRHDEWPLEEPAVCEARERPDSKVKILKLVVRGAVARWATLFSSRFLGHRDNRNVRFRDHTVPSLIGTYRFYLRYFDYRYNAKFKGEWNQKYYLCPLQVHYDTQITERSNFESIEEFIELTTASFMKHAPEDTMLIFKVHPMDRGYKDYKTEIELLKERYQTKRILYIDRIHLPTALRHARACITINSSVGLSAVEAKTPTLVLGEAIYDLEEVTVSCGLDEIWTSKEKVNKRMVDKFISLLKITTQAQGVMYQRTLHCDGYAKIQWPPLFKHLFERNNEDTHSL